MEKSTSTPLANGPEGPDDLLSIFTSTAPMPRYNEFCPDTLEENDQRISLSINPDGTFFVCSKCQAIQAWLKEHYFLKGPYDHIFSHYEHSREFMRSVLSGCHLCTLLWESSRLNKGNSNRSQLRDGTLHDLSGGVKLVIKGGMHGFRLAVHVYVQLADGTEDGGEGLDPTTEPPSWPPSEAARRSSLASTSTASPASITLAKRWIADCVRDHSKCAMSNSSYTPTRLIDVSLYRSTGGIKIMDMKECTNNSNKSYVALSYCWGQNPKLILETSTYKLLTTGISVEELPRTLQDAIRFTDDIEIRWLWIDSLCIIQDSQEDWRREARSMGQIYQHAFLTIGALGASDSGEGLYSLRNPLLYSPCRLFTTRSGRPIYMRHCDMGPRLSHAWPLHRRGWVMQERLLAPRTLNFGPYMIWKCRERLEDEYDIYAPYNESNGLDFSSSFFDVILSSGAAGSSGTEQSIAIFDLWNKIAGIYTDCQLKIATDRLIAISGIIAAIEIRTGWKNWVGLWEPFLWQQLLWHRGRRCLLSSCEVTGLLPTWSWISTTGSVDWWYRCSIDHRVRPIADIKRAGDGGIWESKIGNGRWSALLISCRPTKMLPLKVSTWDRGYAAELHSHPLSVTAYFDPDLQTSTEVPEIFLPIALGPRGGSVLWVYGLGVARSLRCEGAFERVGLVSTRYETVADGPDNMNTADCVALLDDKSLREDFILV